MKCMKRFTVKQKTLCNVAWGILLILFMASWILMFITLSKPLPLSTGIVMKYKHGFWGDYTYIKMSDGKIIKLRGYRGEPGDRVNKRLNLTQSPDHVKK